MGMRYFLGLTGAEVLAKAKKAKHRRAEEVAFYCSNGGKNRAARTLANHFVTSELKCSKGYLMRLLIVANSPSFVHDLITAELVAADTVVEIHFCVKRDLKRMYTTEELRRVYNDLKAFAEYYHKPKIMPLLVEKYFKVGRFETSKKYADIDDL